MKKETILIKKKKKLNKVILRRKKEFISLTHDIHLSISLELITSPYYIPIGIRENLLNFATANNFANNELYHRIHSSLNHYTKSLGCL